MSILKLLFKTIYYAIFFVIVSVTGLLLISLFPLQDNYQVKTVLSGSMEPAIHIGSVVIIKAAQNYNIGDVITFGKDTQASIPVTHRVVEKNKVGFRTTFKTKGDANDNIDPVTINKSDIIGKTLFTIPYLGFVLDFVKQPAGFVTFVVLPGVLISLAELWKIAVEVSRTWRKPKNTVARKVVKRQAVVAPVQIDEVEMRTVPIPATRARSKRYI